MHRPRCHTENSDASTFCGACGAPLGPAADGAPEDASVTRTVEAPLHGLTAGMLVAGKYQVLDEIGRGGMGLVYKAEDLTLKRCVALKFLPPYLVDAPEFRERFTIEAQAAAALSHPNICVTIVRIGGLGARGRGGREHNARSQTPPAPASGHPWRAPPDTDLICWIHSYYRFHWEETCSDAQSKQHYWLLFPLSLFLC